MKRDLSAGAPGAKVDQLDESIDQVVSRMVRVEERDAFASQIIDALPDRSMRSGWWFQAWAPRLAMVAVLVVAGIVWGTRGSRERVPVLQPLASSQPHSATVTYAASVRERLEPNGTIALEPLGPLEPSIDDFPHSLPSIAAVASLELEAIAPSSLREDAPLTLAPLAIADLPTAESGSPRDLPEPQGEGIEE